jgi:hypothetical protein
LENQADDNREANNLICTQLNQLTPSVFEAFCENLMKKQLHLMAHMEYPSPYSPFDFASFLNSTISNFFNAFHCNGGTKIWTLVCWIPIFHQLNSPEDSAILANNGFDMVGVQFNFRDSQVYLDLNHEMGVNLCVFRSTDHRNQTLHDGSLSQQYTRIGFSCHANACEDDQGCP